MTQRCAVVGSTSRHRADGATAYSPAARATRATQTICARLWFRPGEDSPRRCRASSAAMSCTTTPNRAYARNIGTTSYRTADGRTNVNAPIVRSGDSEHTSAATATTTRTGTRASDAGGRAAPSACSGASRAALAAAGHRDDRDDPQRRRCPSRGSPAARAAPRGHPPPPRRDAPSRRRADSRPAEPDNSTISRCSGTGPRAGTRRPRGPGRRRGPRTRRMPAPMAARRARLPTVTPSRRVDPGCARETTSQYAATATGVMTAAIKPP